MRLRDLMLGRKVRIIDHTPPSMTGCTFPTPYRFEIEISDCRQCYVRIDLTEREFTDLRFRGVIDHIVLNSLANHSKRYLFVRIPKWSVGMLNKKLEEWQPVKNKDGNFRIPSPEVPKIPSTDVPRRDCTTCKDINCLGGAVPCPSWEKKI